MEVASAETIPSPLKLDDPAIINFGVTYQLQGKILAIEPNSNGSILIQHDINGVSTLSTNNTNLGRKIGDNTFEPVSHQDFKVGQTFQTSVAFTFSDKKRHILNITIIE